MPIKKTEKPKSYLERLQFDPKLLSSPVAKYISNIRVVILIAVSISLLGFMSYLNLPKRLNPEVKIPIVTVQTVLPGAGPDDVESLVTIPLENEVRGVKGVDTVSSFSQNNVSYITAQFFSNVDGEKAKVDVQDAVNTVHGLPANATTPSVSQLDFENTPIWTFAVTTSQQVPDLMSFTDELKRKITDLPKVDRVVTSGFETQEIDISVTPEKVQEYGLNPLVLSQTIQKGIASYPAGSITANDHQYSLTIDPSIVSIDDIRNLPLSVQGKTLHLSDIASVVEKSKENQQISFLATKDMTSQRAVTFYVYKSGDVNIDEAGASVKKVVDEVVAEHQNKFKITTLVNSSDEISKQFIDLLGEFRSTIILVFVALFLFLGLRQAIISSITVPLTFLSAFFFMQFFGMSINFLSLFAFLLALGLLVDDTIVVVSAMTFYYKSGKFTPLETGLLVWKDTIIPIWSTTITTIWSFVPLLISTGIIGEFIKPIPIVVTITMISSTAIAVLITLPLMIILLKPNIPKRLVTLAKVVVFLLALGALLSVVSGSPVLPVVAIVYVVFTFILLRTFPQLKNRWTVLLKKSSFYQKISPKIDQYTNNGVINVEPFSQWYHNTIIKVLDSASSRRRALIAVVAYAVICFSLLPLGLVKNEFFPKTDANLFYVNLKMSPGTVLSQTQALSDTILEDLRKTPNAEFVTAEVGRSSIDNSTPSDALDSTLFTIHLKPKEMRQISSTTLADAVQKKYANFPNATVTVTQESGGPPAGSDLQIAISGDDLGQVDQYADKVVNFLKSQPGASNVNKSVKSGPSKLTFVPDQQKLIEANVSPDTIGFWLRVYASGYTLDSINFDKSTTEKTDVVFRINGAQKTPEGLSELSLTNQSGVNYPLLSLGSLVAKSNPTVITRQDGKRTISVSASVKSGYVTTDENKKLEDFANTKLNLAKGYSWKTGGANEENDKSVQSILQSMVIAAVLILITMVVQFGSFRQAIIVLIVIPLAVSSVFLAFALTGTPLSFPALIGVLSLFGIVVTNSMFIVDKINLNRKQGMKFKESIADAGASRLEPIILTKLCTVLGLLPITISDPLWRGLGGAIISGLLVSSTIMLLFIPVLYYTWFHTEEEAKDNLK